ncbi:MAG: YceI family protein [Desulfobulbaceae bacterium]|nr:YceI family protein [Desulfobulbaceae bacterium]
MKTWRIDPDHSVAAFTVRHLTVAKVHGQFNTISGMVNYDSADQAGFSLEAVIDTAGIYTGINKRDDHLRSPDFFDVTKFPAITFHSTGFAAREDNRGNITGQLTVHGITRQVILDAAISGPVKSPEEIGGEMTIGISARTMINREDFGITWNVPLAGGGVMIGRTIEIFLEIEADLER